MNIDETGPELPTLALDHPAWCTSLRPDDDHGVHQASMGDLAAQGTGQVLLGLWQVVGGRPFVQLSAQRGAAGDDDDAACSVFLSPRQAAWLGRRLIEAAAMAGEG